MTQIADDVEEQEIGLLGFSLWSNSKVKKQLWNLCLDVKKRLGTRISVFPVIEASVKAFHDTECCDENDPNVETEADVRVKALFDNLCDSTF